MGPHLGRDNHAGRQRRGQLGAESVRRACRSVTTQDVFYWVVDDDAWAIDRVPAWIEDGGSDTYGQVLIAPLDDAGRVWVAGGGSGHGAKHGPSVGGYVADPLEGKEAPDPRFGLVRAAARA